VRGSAVLSGAGAVQCRPVQCGAWAVQSLGSHPDINTCTTPCTHHACPQPLHTHTSRHARFPPSIRSATETAAATCCHRFHDHDHDYGYRYSERLGQIIDEEVKSIVETAHKRTAELLTTHSEALEKVRSAVQGVGVLSRRDQKWNAPQRRCSKVTCSGI
jgi:hypothetical protein